MNKLIFWAVGTLVVVVVLVIVAVTFFLGPIIRQTVSFAMSGIVGVNAKIEHADANLWNGQLLLRGLEVGNPDGFASDHAFRLGELSVDVDMGTVLMDTIIVREVVISGADLMLELKTTGTNLGHILRTLKGKAAAKPASTEEPKAYGKKIVIERFVFENGVARLGTTMTGGELVGVPLPRIELTDIGKASGGATAAAAVYQVLDEILSAATNAVSAAGLNIGGVAIEGIKGAAGAAGEAASALGDTVGNVIEGAGSTVGELQRAFGF